MSFQFSKRVGAGPKAETPRAASASPPADGHRRGEPAPTDTLNALRRAEQAWGHRPDLHHHEPDPNQSDTASLLITREQRDAISACASTAAANGRTADAMKALSLVTAWDLTFSAER